ncbi:MAG: ABC transporter ATP-binding protein [Treponema sp.]|jgi:peptide/nickel transport system ATP-binding protein|nr:ABC transporter ATP-binding protein [Treponema sp.]
METAARERKKVVEVRNLAVSIPLDEGLLTPVRGISFSVYQGEVLGMVGESGCGKSLTSKAILGINDKRCKTTGEILFTQGEEVQDLLKLKYGSPEIRKIRGKSASMIFQEPMAAFHPMYTIGDQINECCLLHITPDKKAAKEISLDMMKRVGIANAEKRYDQYPYEFSGGMLQRALIAMALVCRPSLLVADEPTTALDVTIQAQILDLMKQLQAEFGMAIIFITHDLGIMAKMCDRLAVMYLGKIIEEGPVREIYKNPLHPYTRGLIASVHKVGTHSQEKLFSIDGAVPLAMNIPDRCGFYDRCKERCGRCDHGEPVPRDTGNGRRVSCFLYDGEEAHD